VAAARMTAPALALVNDRHLSGAINDEEIMSTVHSRRAAMMHASAGLAL
jgi:hypothetical protein